MKIIICGAGQVGGQIARHLSREEGGNTVTVIDLDAGRSAVVSTARLLLDGRVHPRLDVRGAIVHG